MILIASWDYYGTVWNKIVVKVCFSGVCYYIQHSSGINIPGNPLLPCIPGLDPPFTWDPSQLWAQFPGKQSCDEILQKKALYDCWEGCFMFMYWKKISCDCWEGYFMLIYRKKALWEFLEKTNSVIVQKEGVIPL